LTLVKQAATSRLQLISQARVLGLDPPDMILGGPRALDEVSGLGTLGGQLGSPEFHFAATTWDGRIELSPTLTAAVARLDGVEELALARRAHMRDVPLPQFNCCPLARHFDLFAARCADIEICRTHFYRFLFLVASQKIEKNVSIF
jgi:hypothetical protein